MSFHLATADLAGLHRDEHYYLAGGHHLAWGYVDHPPLVPFLYRLSEEAFGHSQLGLHVLPSVIGGVFVIVAALLARELGGRTLAQGVVAALALLSPITLTTAHFLSTVTLDIVFWSLASLLVLRIVRTGDARLWLAVGAVIGVGLMNKHSMLFWVAGAAVGLLATKQRRILWTPWVLAGAAIAFVIVLPNLLWQIDHDWPTWEFLRNLRENDSGENMGEFIPLQLGVLTIGGLVVWVTGLVALCRRGSAFASARWLAVGYAFLFVALFVTGGKGYYLASWYLPLAAVGAVGIEQAWSRRAQTLVLVAVLATGIVFVPLFTPVMPEDTIASLGLDDINDDLSGMLGWHHVAQQVADVVHSLPPDERKNAVVLGGSYSQAGVVDFWREADDLPRAYSGHNSYWWWGHPKGEDHTVVTLGFSADVLDRYFDDCEHRKTLGRDGVPIDTEQEGAEIYVCRGQRQSWSKIWPQLRFYS